MNKKNGELSGLGDVETVYGTGLECHSPFLSLTIYKTNAIKDSISLTLWPDSFYLYLDDAAMSDLEPEEWTIKIKRKGVKDDR